MVDKIRETLTVAELIEVLSSFPEGHHVVVPGYEGGFLDLHANEIRLIKLKLYAIDSPYQGPHDEFDEKDDQTYDEEAVVIGSC